MFSRSKLRRGLNSLSIGFAQREKTILHRPIWTRGSNYDRATTFALTRNIWTDSYKIDDSAKTTIWSCERLFLDVSNRSLYKQQDHEKMEHVTDREAVIVVDSELPKDFKFTNFWNSAKVKICADGGANRLYKFDKDKFIPDYVVGDFDSAEPAILDYYKSKGADVCRDIDQETTDLQKALHQLQKLETKTTYETITIMGGLGGNFSHELANLNSLFHYPSRQMFLVSPCNACFVLPKGKHIISIAPKKFKKKGEENDKTSNTTYEDLKTSLREEDAKQKHDAQLKGHEKESDAKSMFDLDWKPKDTIYCSLLPIGEKCQNIRTRGLRWELDGQQLAFGELVSSSNELLHSIVELEVSSPLVFTFDFRKD